MDNQSKVSLKVRQGVAMVVLTSDLTSLMPS